jgi:hypothetical protein
MHVLTCDEWLAELGERVESDLIKLALIYFTDNRLLDFFGRQFVYTAC